MRSYELKVEKEVKNIIDSIRKYFVKNGNKDTKAIIGISGGKDSTIAAALLVRALGPERVIGVLMPNGVQDDIKDAYEVCHMLNIKFYEINIAGPCQAIYNAIQCGYPGYDGLIGDNKKINTNTPSRVRMTILYAIAAMEHGRVINTGNASEKYVGYTTKYGDLAGDFALFTQYYVRDVVAIGDYLELPRHLVHKEPSDGMSGKTDADNMGFTYEVLDNYLIDGIVPDVDTLKNIEDRHSRNEHKDNVQIPCCVPVSRWSVLF